MSPSLEHELRRHATALRGLARALVGEGDADDLLQEAALQALRSPPRAPGPLGGWLAGIVRHLASRQRRSASRRRLREAAAARDEAIPPDRSVEDRDTLRALTDAVLALPEPYRETVIQRYLRALPPSAIAAKSGVPVETLKSRLKRGLVLLREHLAARGVGEDWRLALGTAFGLEGAAAVKTTGVLVMTTGAKLAFGGVAAALAVMVGLWMLRGGEPEATPVAAAPVASTPVAGDSTVEKEAQVAGAPAPQRIVQPVPAAAALTAVIKGRCVDDQGARLAGCAIELRVGATAAASIASGEDGSFELPCAPVAGDITLRAGYPDRATAELGWPGIAAGQVIEAGDLVLARVRTVRLRTVDGSGRPVARACVCTYYGMVRTDDAGAATMQLAIGAQYLQCVPPALVEQVTVPEGDGAFDLLMPLADETARIEGVVVDAAGAPVPMATVSGHAPGQTSGRRTRCGEDGSFAIARPGTMPADTCDLTVTASGFEAAELTAVPWNARTLRIALRPGIAVTLRVRQQGGAPVEQFTADLWSSADQGSTIQHLAGTFPGGIATIAGMRRGRGQVSVRPASRDLSDRLFVPFAINDATARIDVVLPPIGSRQLLVLYEDGSPVVGAPFELMQTVNGRKPTVRSWAGMFRGDPDQWDSIGASEGMPAPAVLVLAGTTDGRGAAALRGPPDELLALRLRGAETRFVEDVALRELAPLVIRLPLAGSVRGSIGPALLVQRLSSLMSRANRDTAEPLRLSLQQGSKGMQCAVATDGTFEQNNVPPGLWRLQLVLGAAQISYPLPPIGTVDVQPGAATECRFELPDLVPGEIRATVTLDGVPTGKANLLLIDTASKGGPRRSARQWTADDGTAVLWPMAATYRITMTPPAAAGECAGALTLADPITVVAGANLAATFKFVSGRARLRIIDRDGQPVVGVHVEADGRERMQLRLGPTDIDGHTALRVQPGTYSLFAWRRDLQDDKARSAFRNGKPTPEQQAQARLALGSIELPEGQVVEREIRLPAAWER